MDTLFAEVVETEHFFYDLDPVRVKQVRLSIFGTEYLLDPDQAERLIRDMKYSLNEIEGK